MKPISLLSLAAFLVLSFSVNAQKAHKSKGEKGGQEESAKQGGLTAEQIAEKQTKKFTEKLKLTDGQIPKVKQVLLERAQTAEKDRERCKEDRDCLKMARRERNAVAERQLKQILTQEQYAKLQEIRKQARDKKRKELEKQSGKRNAVDSEEEFAESEYLNE